MLTKLVVSVPRPSSTTPARPSPEASIIAPGSLLPAARAATRPSGMNHRLVSARPRKVAQAPRVEEAV